MFKKFGMMLLAACFLLPVQAKASDQLGVYVAPKFALNVQHFKADASEVDGTGMNGDSKNAARAGGALAIGYDFSKKFAVPVRAEIEYGAYGNASQDFWGFNDLNTPGLNDALSLKHTVGFQTLLANVYWDITTWNNFTPYVGAGIGMAFVKTEAEYAYTGPGEYITGSNSKTETVFAGQLGLGCSYAFNDYISADIGYRFLMMDSAKATSDFVKLKSKDLYAHQFMLGLRVTF